MKLSLIFFTFSLIDFIDIALVALLLSFIYRRLRGRNVFYIFMGIITFILLYFIIKALNFNLLSSLLGTILSVGPIMFIVIFQPEIRAFLSDIGKQSELKNPMNRFFRTSSNLANQSTVNGLIVACEEMSRSNTGGLIVISPNLSSVRGYIETGIPINAKFSKELLLSIFYKNSPLHDGGVIIVNNQIIAARCILPLTTKTLRRNVGLRHRAALGISEKEAVHVLIVSEQTGNIALAKHGKLIYEYEISKLQNELISQNS